MIQKDFFGKGSIKFLSGILKDLNCKKVFLITGKSSFASSGAEKKILPLIKDDLFFTFSDFSPNPRLEEIMKGLEFFEKQDYDVIISVGGGSALDTAKAIKLFYYRRSGKKVPLIAVPTTVGTGSEATHFIVFYSNGEKQSEGDPEISLPNYSICDPEFTYSLPKKIIADTGADAFSQAVESYWSVKSTKKSKKYSREAIKLILSNFKEAVNSSDKEALSKMLCAANLAGKAINITKTTACHSISYPLTSLFKIPHGHAVILTLGEMIVFNEDVGIKDCEDSRGPTYVKNTIKELLEIFGVSSTEEARNKIISLMKEVGLQTKLSELGLEEADVELVSSKVSNPERMKNNPRSLSNSQIKKILIKIL
jgi:alcohol dehydrogenase class IV